MKKYYGVVVICIVLGILTNGSILAEEKIVIGSLGAFSGPYASMGEDQVRGSEYAIEEAGGKVLGKPVELMFIDTEVKPGLRAEKRTTATVGVDPEGSAHLDNEQVLAIRHLVAPAIGGLRPENVTVTDLKNGRSYYGDPENGGGPMDDPYGARKRMYEQAWTAKILNLLDYIDGVRVALDVELVPELVNRSDSVSYEKPVTIQETIEGTIRTNESRSCHKDPRMNAGED